MDSWLTPKQSGTSRYRRMPTGFPQKANKLKGPLVNQADIFPDLANPTFQDHANEAIHRFIT
jgi:hypothetical protein